MSEARRQLAAIMFTDIVGYTALMGENSAKALELVHVSKEIQKPLVENHNGKWLKEMGDGVLVQFNTALDAVNCAVEIQEQTRAKFDGKLRIGIHSGDITIEDDDVYGDGVNVASRLESIADPGGIYISDAILKAIQGQSDIQTKYLGEIPLKNVAYDLRTYAIQGVGLPVPADIDKDSANLTATKKKFPIWAGIGVTLVVITLAFYLYPRILGEFKNGDPEPVNQKESEVLDRSIAVLPFLNMSNDPDQEYFSDGMMEEILNYLFQIGDLQVTSRTSVMQYKGTTKTIPQIANELGVSTILEGSVRKSGNKVRITVQLINGKTDKHLWAKTYDREINDVFAVQSEVAENVASTLQAEIRPEVRLRIESQPTSSTEAYDLYLQARNLSWSDEDQNQMAIELLEKVIKLDPGFSSAYAAIGQRLSAGATMMKLDGGTDPGRAWIISKPYLENALSLDPENGLAHGQMGNALLYFEWDFQGAHDEYEQAKKIFPNFTPVDYLMAMGRFDDALAGAEYAFEINPGNEFNKGAIMEANYFAGNQQEAVRIIEEIIEDSLFTVGPYTLSSAIRISSYLGMHSQVLDIVAILRALQPNLIPRDLGFTAIAEYHLGHEQRTFSNLEELKNKSSVNAGGSPSFYLAMIYAQMGEIEAAFEWLNKAYEDREVEMYWLKVEPPFEPLHDDPRWQEILDKVGFPD
jgi:TolB-like protein/class 3 adenylate cyclase/tetratricopeptide (TPR) repeat protein